MYAILIVQLSNKQWSFSITRDHRRVYASLTFWDSLEELWEAALAEYHEVAKGKAN